MRENKNAPKQFIHEECFICSVTWTSKFSDNFDSFISVQLKHILRAQLIKPWHIFRLNYVILTILLIVLVLKVLFKKESFHLYVTKIWLFSNATMHEDVRNWKPYGKSSLSNNSKAKLFSSFQELDFTSIWSIKILASTHTYLKENKRKNVCLLYPPFYLFVTNIALLKEHN